VCAAVALRIRCIDAGSVAPEPDPLLATEIRREEEEERAWLL
jgi:hypothetical protein